MIGLKGLQTSTVIDDMNDLARRATAGPRCIEEAKEEVIPQVATGLLRAIKDSDVGRVLDKIS